jgi:hypothetical protein
VLTIQRLSFIVFGVDALDVVAGGIVGGGRPSGRSPERPVAGKSRVRRYRLFSDCRLE